METWKVVFERYRLKMSRTKTEYMPKCSVHVSDGFPKKVWTGGWVGGMSSIQFFFDNQFFHNVSHIFANAD